VKVKAPVAQRSRGIKERERIEILLAGFQECYLAPSPTDLPVQPVGAGRVPCHSVRVLPEVGSRRPRSARAYPGRGSVAGPESIVRGGLLLTLVVVIAQTTTQLVDFGLYGLRIGALNSNHHASVFGVASLLAQGAAALAAALRLTGSRRRGMWALVTALIAALLYARVSVAFSTTLLLVPVIALFALLWRATADDRAPARTALRAGLCLLVCSFAVHVVGPEIVSALGYTGNSWPYQVKGVLKHGGELGGWILVATGLLAGAEPRTRRAGRPREQMILSR
jgi:uncharacterized membrane protein YfbV (UPF0208 family)